MEIRPWYRDWRSPGPKVINFFSCSAPLRLKFILLKNIKMPTIDKLQDLGT